MAAVLGAVKERKIFKEGLLPLIEKALVSTTPIGELLPPKAAERELDESIVQTAESLKNENFSSDDSRQRRAMGLIMEKWRGRIDGTEAALKLGRYLKDGTL
jgi:Glu-tRNA(Gln) amidotransferase subunit E-like FAD-binding protein